MASAGTLLSDLGGSAPGDGDLVQKILSDMNIPTTSQRPVPPPLPAQTPPHQAQQAMTTQSVTMDSRVPTSHMIGNDHPTPADFAAAMIGMANPRPDLALNAAPVGAMPGTEPVQYEAPSKNYYSLVIQEIKVPLVVALLFFVFSLPPIRVLLAHYMPTLIKATGEFHLTGLLVVSGVVGGTFWLLQRVIAPLLSL